MTAARGGDKGKGEKHAGGRPPKFATPEDMQEGIDAYFAERDDKEKPYTIAGLAYHLDMTTQGLREYQTKDEFSCIIKKAKQKVELSVESLLLEGKGAGAIFWLKNHAGYSDTQKMELSGSDGKPIEHKHDISDDMLAAIAAGKNG